MVNVLRILREPREEDFSDHRDQHDIKLIV